MAKLLCKSGTYQQFNVDPLTKAKITFALSSVQHLTSIEPSTSGIIRAAVAHYVNHLDSLLELPKDDLAIHMLRHSINNASKGDSVRPRLQSLLSENRTDGDFPSFGGMEKESHKGAFAFMKHPISSGRKWK